MSNKRYLHHVTLNIHPLTTKQWIMKCLAVERVKLWKYNRHNSLRLIDTYVFSDGVTMSEMDNIEQVIEHMNQVKESNKKVFINLIISNAGEGGNHELAVTLWCLESNLFLTLSGYSDMVSVIRNLNNVTFRGDESKKYTTLKGKVRQVLKEFKVNQLSG